MTVPISAEPPIVVLVEEGSWAAYSLHPEPTERDQELLSLLQSIGGINETVEKGAYHFNAAPLDETNTVVSLEPIRRAI